MGHWLVHWHTAGALAGALISWSIGWRIGCLVDFPLFAGKCTDAQPSVGADPCSSGPWPLVHVAHERIEGGLGLEVGASFVDVGDSTLIASRGAARSGHSVWSPSSDAAVVSLC